MRKIAYFKWFLVHIIHFQRKLDRNAPKVRQLPFLVSWSLKTIIWRAFDAISARMRTKASKVRQIVDVKIHRKSLDFGNELTSS